MKRYGFEVFELEPLEFRPFPDGRHLVLYRDEARNVEAIRAFSRARRRGLSALERVLGARLEHRQPVPPADAADPRPAVHGRPRHGPNEPILEPAGHDELRRPARRVVRVGRRQGGTRPLAATSAIRAASARATRRRTWPAGAWTSWPMSGTPSASCAAAWARSRRRWRARRKRNGADDSNERRGPAGPDRGRPGGRRRARRRFDRAREGRRLERRSEADVPAASSGGIACRPTSRPASSASAPGSRTSSSTPRCASCRTSRAYLGARLRPADDRPHLDQPVGRLLRAGLARRGGRAAVAQPGDVDPDSRRPTTTRSRRRASTCSRSSGCTRRSIPRPGRGTSCASRSAKR